MKHAFNVSLLKLIGTSLLHSFRNALALSLPSRKMQLLFGPLTLHWQTFNELLSQRAHSKLVCWVSYASSLSPCAKNTEGKRFVSIVSGILHNPQCLLLLYCTNSRAVYGVNLYYVVPGCKRVLTDSWLGRG